MSEPDTPTLTAAQKAQLREWWRTSPLLTDLHDLVADWLAEARAEALAPVKALADEWELEAVGLHPSLAPHARYSRLRRAIDGGLR